MCYVCKYLINAALMHVDDPEIVQGFAVETVQVFEEHKFQFSVGRKIEA